VVLAAVAAQQRPSLPSIYAADLTTKLPEGTFLRYHISSDGNEVVIAKYTQAKEYNLTQFDYIFKKNQTRYVIQTNTRFCDSKFVNATELHQSDPLENWNRMATGPGGACQDANGRGNGHLWKLKDKNLQFTACISDDGSKMFFLESTSADGLDIKKWTVTVNAGTPDTSVLQMEPPCVELTKPLSITTSYYTQWIQSEAKDGKTTVSEGTVTRQANGDVEHHTTKPTSKGSFFVAKESNLYKVDDESAKKCVKSAAKFSSDDFLSDVVGNKFWYASSAHCNGEEGTLWKENTSENTLCTTLDNNVPIWMKTDTQNITWISFRPNNLPAFTLPNYCN